MKLLAPVPVCLSFIFAVAGCIAMDDGRPFARGGSAIAESPNGYSCSAADECASGVCLLLNSNAQGKPGICSERCGTSHDCAHGGTCVQSDVGGICVVPCTSNASCVDGFVCLTGAPRVCFVEPGSTQDDGGCSTVVYGSCRTAIACVEQAGVSREVTQSAKAACSADAGGLWSDGPCPLLDLLGGCRSGCSVSRTTWYYKGGSYASAADVKTACEGHGEIFVTP